MDESSVGVPDSNALWQAAAADRRVLTGRFDEPVAVVTTCRLGALPLYSSGVLDIQECLAGAAAVACAGG